ncbi:hypothetical protein GIS00_05515 [Nakamurella sp. YIM 132087]|uniref:LPXTG cell wall anchor domain-containing protein n=1 Tax=Nakamurella alba TaxID=2665158 RepID=A0A7K1FH01_9ACTN|nr:hypothetical protein [Nakamurella alba]MTD13401.1 hypothetical protein [Nakamurella alba]
MGTASAAAPGTITLTPSTLAPGASYEVSGTGCTASGPGVTQVIVDPGDGSDLIAVEPAADGSWSTTTTASATAGSYIVVAACDRYTDSYEYTPATLTVVQLTPSGTIGDITRAGCKVDIPIATGDPVTYKLDVYDDGDVVDTITFTPTAADKTTVVTWVITEPAREEAPGVGFYLTGPDGESLDSVDPYEYPASAADACAEAGDMTIYLSGDEVSQGGALDITAAGFYPDETVTVTLHSTPIVLGSFIADASGAVAGTVTIPTDAEVGAHTITLDGVTSGLSVSADIYVLAASAGGGGTGGGGSSGGGSGPDLAATGVDSLGIASWGVGLVLVGGAALALARRRSVS